MTQPTTLPEKWYEKIYDVLIEHAGASKYEKKLFIERLPSQHLTEWRFMGKLKEGGKVVLQGDKWFVTCRMDHATPPRMEIIGKTNAHLRKLYAEFMKEKSDG